MNDIEKAIEQLKSDIDTIKSVYSATALEKIKEHFMTCYMTAISALEKQKPKKPLEQRYVNYEIENELIGHCPSCQLRWDVAYWQRHCSNCGQKLDWSVEE